MRDCRACDKGSEHPVDLREVRHADQVAGAVIAEQIAHPREHGNVGDAVVVTEAAQQVLEKAGGQAGLRLELEQDLAGGACYDRHGCFLREDTLQRARQVDAILFGSQGGPPWDSLDLPGGPTDKSGLSKLRKELDQFANIRPVRSWPGLADRTPFRAEVIEGVDLVVLRELTAGFYFGEPRGIFDDAQGLRVIGEKHHPEIRLDHRYADACLFELVRNPRQFDVIVADNLFGDLLSDCAASIAGSLGLLPSTCGQLWRMTQHDKTPSDQLR